MAGEGQDFYAEEIKETKDNKSKRRGYLSIDDEGVAFVPWSLRFGQDVQELTDAVLDIDCRDGQSLDYTITQDTLFNLLNMQNGQEIKVIVVNAVPAFPGPVADLTAEFDSPDIIKWLNGNDDILMPADTTDMFIFYKSNEIIYAEVKKNYLQVVFS